MNNDPRKRYAPRTLIPQYLQSEEPLNLRAAFSMHIQPLYPILSEF